MIVHWAFATFVIIAAAIVAAVRCTPVRADPEHMERYHADPRYDEFFHSLQRPDGQGSCCSLDDCRQTEAEFRDGQWFAVVDGKWRAVPPERVLASPLSIDGEAYICHGDSWPGGQSYTPGGAP